MARASRYEVEPSTRDTHGVTAFGASEVRDVDAIAQPLSTIRDAGRATLGRVQPGRRVQSWRVQEGCT
jgi:hypothetical protein